MSERSLKRYIKHRDRKERAQLSHRKHLGLLEKQKDYKVRGDDFRKKRARIRMLQAKAETRNPDEFSHKMNQKKLDSHGNVVQNQQQHRNANVMKRDKEVDVAFLKSRMKAQRRLLRDQHNSLAALDQMDKVERTQVIFVDSDDEVEDWDAAQHFDTLPELVGQTHNRLKRDQLDEELIVNKITPGMLKKVDQAKKEAYEKVREDEKLLREMKQAHDQNVLQRHLMDGGRYQKIVKKDIFGEEIKSKTRYKWKTERKR